MKTTTILGIGVAIFAGVLGALQLDHFLERKSDRPALNFEKASSATIQPIGLETTLPGAPFDFRAAAKKVNPSVVAVDRFSRVSRGFMDREGVVAETGQGSGVIIDKSGIIVTNNHVVERAERVKVRLSDNRTIDAKVLGTDPRSDLAVLKIDAPNLVPIELGERDELEVGEWVVAVGNPLGFSNTLSVGVISSLKRNLPVGQQGLVDAIQTDAAINPGNSGGALCDIQGRLIGVNSAIATPNQGSVGIGFAIPIDRVKTVVADIVKLGYARYAGLGVSYPRVEGAIQYPEVRQQIAEQTGVENIPNAGIVVSAVSGAAGDAGIKPFDVILAIDNQKVEGTFDLNKALVPHKPGDTVTVKYWSRGQTKTAKVKLQEIRQTL
ncbi:MAG: S1C family serine protease [Fimbriimonas sp.]